MSLLAEWSYVRARLQARHGDRLCDPEWRALEAARTLERFIDQSRSTPLWRFTNHLDAQMTSHMIERVLRAEWRSYVAEVAGWTSPAWKPAVLWAGHVPDLMALDRVLAGDKPNWTREDPAFGPLMGMDRIVDAAKLENSPLSPLLARKSETGGVAERWLAHWRAIWPRSRTGGRQGRDTLVGLVKAHIGQLAQADEKDASRPHRHKLDRALTRMFRREGGTPLAVFCHLALVALDLERLRGGLLRRRLFGAEYAKRAT